MVDVDDSSLQADSQPNSVGSVSGSAAAWCRLPFYSHHMKWKKNVLLFCGRSSLYLESAHANHTGTVVYQNAYGLRSVKLYLEILQKKEHNKLNQTISSKLRWFDSGW